MFYSSTVFYSYYWNFERSKKETFTILVPITHKQVNLLLKSSIKNCNTFPKIQNSLHIISSSSTDKKKMGFTSSLSFYDFFHYTRFTYLSLCKCFSLPSGISKKEHYSLKVFCSPSRAKQLLETYIKKKLQKTCASWEEQWFYTTKAVMQANSKLDFCQQGLLCSENPQILHWQ